MTAPSGGSTDFDLSAEAEAGLLDFFDVEAWQKAPEQPAVNQLVRSRPEQVEVWMRSPHNFRPALEENPYPRFAFWNVDLVRRGVRPLHVLSRLLPPDMPFTWMVVHGTHAEIFTCSPGLPQSRTASEPTRVPVWKYGDDPANLLRLCRAYPDRGWDRIVVGVLKRNVPLSVMERQRLNEWLHRVAGAFPHVRLHLTGSNSFSQAFGLNFHSVDLDPANNVSMGMVRLPNGRSCSAMRTSKHLKWVHVLGYSAEQLRLDHYCRVGFNMRSILWAAEHWNDTEALKPQHHRKRNDPLGLIGEAGHDRPKVRNATLRSIYRTTAPDPDFYPQFSPDPFEPYDYAEPVTNTPNIAVRPRVKDSGDKIACNFCSLADSCRVYREGAVCALTDSPSADLAAMFGTRDADTIRSALGRVLEAQTERYERAKRRYREDDESDIYDIKRSEHLMKMENSLVRSGSALVKLLDPSFRQAPVPAIMSSQMHVYNPRVLVADVVKQLEAQGVDLKTVDPARILDVAQAQGLLPPAAGPAPAAQQVLGESFGA